MRKIAARCLECLLGVPLEYHARERPTGKYEAQPTTFYSDANADIFGATQHCEWVRIGCEPACPGQEAICSIAFCISSGVTSRTCVPIRLDVDFGLRLLRKTQANSPRSWFQNRLDKKLPVDTTWACFSPHAQVRRKLARQD
jgi:hypothetical protein